MNLVRTRRLPFQFWRRIFKWNPNGGVRPSDIPKASRTFPSGSEILECPIDIDDYFVAPSVFPENSDGKFLLSPMFPPTLLSKPIIFKTFGKALERLPLGVVLRLPFSQWRICWCCCTLAVVMEILPTVLDEALGNTVVEIYAVGFAIKVRLTFEVKSGQPLWVCWDGPFWFRNRLFILMGHFRVKGQDFGFGVI